MCLGRGSCVGFPHPRCAEPRYGRSYLAAPMDSAGVLCAPGDVALAALAGGSRRAAEHAQR